MSLLEIFCDVDDFVVIFDQWLKTHVLTQTPSTRGRKARLSMSEVMTILIWFHQSHYRDFEAFLSLPTSIGKHRAGICILAAMNMKARGCIQRLPVIKLNCVEDQQRKSA